VNGASSGPVGVNCSVPQGSVLGPIQFISYMEDVSTVFHHHRVRHHLYADDKQAYKPTKTCWFMTLIELDTHSRTVYVTLQTGVRRENSSSMLVRLN